MVCFVNFLMDSFSITKKDELLLTTKSIHKIASNVFCGIYSSTSDILSLSLISSSHRELQSFSWLDVLMNLVFFIHFLWIPHKQKTRVFISWQVTFAIGYRNHQLYLCSERTYRKNIISFVLKVGGNTNILTLMSTQIRVNSILFIFCNIL